MKFSVIIPVYKVENYLRQCVESIWAQTYSDFEIILVDDGSPDKCPQICDELSGIDSRISVIHKPNGGISSARNIGFQKAKGEYIVFMDSDDVWTDRHGLEALAHIAETQFSPDVIIFGVEDYNPESGQKTITRSYPDEDFLNSLAAQSLINTLISRKQFPGAAWMLAAKRSFIDSIQLRFEDGVTAEDFDWIIKLLTNAQSIKVIKNIIYQYRCQSAGSITSKPRVSGVVGIHNAISNWIEADSSDYSSISNYLSGIYLQSLLNFSRLSKEEQSQVAEIVKQDAGILKRSDKLWTTILYLMIKSMGVKSVASVIRTSYNCLHR